MKKIFLLLATASLISSAYAQTSQPSPFTPLVKGTTQNPNTSTDSNNSPPIWNPPIPPVNIPVNIPTLPPSHPNTTSVIQVLPPVETNKVNLNASAKKEVEQDNLVMRLGFTAQGTDAKSVQESLTKEISKALTEAKKNENGKLMQVKSGSFSVYPKYEKQHLVNWTGQADIILEGTDFGLISNTAASLNNLVISNISLGLSPEKSDGLKDEVVQEAIKNFKNEAQKVTEIFGFTNYRIKEVSVNYNPPVALYRANAMMAKSSMPEMASDTLRIDPGKTTVEANVSGSIEMFNDVNFRKSNSQ